MGHGARAASASRVVRQRRAQSAADPPPCAIRPVLEDMRATLLSACRHRGRKPCAAPLQRALGDRIPGAPVPGLSPRLIRARPARGSAEDRSRRLQRMDAGPRDADAESAPGEYRPPGALAPAPYVSRRLSSCAPGPHLLRGKGGGCPVGTASNASGPARVRSSAARGRADGGIQLISALFFVLFFFDGKEASRRTKGFAEIVDGQIANMKRHYAVCALFFDHDDHRAALDAFAEYQAATAGESGVREPLQHTGIILQHRLHVFLELLLRCDA